MYSNSFKSLLSWTLLIFIYLFVEWIYNQHLLIVLSYDEIKPEFFQMTEIFGKCIASFGINLIIKKIFKYKGIKKFIMGIIGGYILLTLLFNYAVEAFPDDFRHSSYYSMLYRKDVTNQQDPNKLLYFANQESWYVKPLLMSYFVFTLNDNTWKKFEADTRKPINEKINKLNKDRNKLWKSYLDSEKARKKLEDFYPKYQEYNRKFMMYKYSKHENRARREFMKKTGIEPELNNWSMFVQGANKKYYDYLTEPVFEGIEEVGVDPIYGKEIKINMSKDEFMAFIDSNVRNVEVKAAPDLHQVRDNKDASDAVAILVIPPISIGLSLISIILNLILVGHAWLYYLRRYYQDKAKIVIAGYYVIISFLFIGIYAFKPNITEKDNYWNVAEQKYAQAFPKLSYFWSFTLKYQSLLCVTEQEPEFVKYFTESLYTKNDLLVNRYGLPYTDIWTERKKRK